jgi:hypothetical protein
VQFLSVVLENSSRQAASDDDVDLWIRNYGLTFPVVSDPDGFVTKFFVKEQMPLNMVIDLRTMTIKSKIVGADLTRVRADIDKYLGG